MRRIPITPTALIKETTERTDTFFGLAHLLEDESYREAAKRACYFSDVSILDNGLYENSAVDLKKLCKYARDLDPRFVVLPDSIESTDQSTVVTLNALNSKENTLKESQVMVVPRANSIKQFREVVLNYLAYYNVRAFGVSALLAPGSRREMACEIFSVWQEYFSHTNDDKPYIHCLGVPRPSDVEALEDSGVVDSVDSAKFFYEPVWRLARRPENYFETEVDRNEEEVKRWLNTL